LSGTAQGRQDIRIIVKDSDQANTVLTDRYQTVSGDFNFFVRMPLCKKFVDVIMVNDADGSDSTFTYTGYKKLMLERRLIDIDFTSYNLNEYITFIQKFCYNCGTLRVNNAGNDNDFYCSENKNALGIKTGKPHFHIKYLPSITDAETGEELQTPARIATDGSFIEVSQKYFVGYAVPARIAVLLHEYSHPFVNSDPDDEEEADMNGLFIYLALGYPRIEGGQAWCDVAAVTPTDQNVKRVGNVEQFITDFDKTKMVIF